MSTQKQAEELLRNLVANCTAARGFGSMSPSIYDTAWVSMLQKRIGNDDHQWLFPESFKFILEQQLPCGGWEAYATAADGILNTAAALLTLQKHLKASQNQEERINWSNRIQKATTALERMLVAWDVRASDQVGLELLVPQHLTLLEQEGIQLEFPQMAYCISLRNAKMARLPLELIYKGPSTLYHSLEAMVGYIDFDRVRPWREANGSMMCSPSSTAAYLMKSSIWDQKAEDYLRTVIKHGVGQGNGSVPCAWPTSIFELTWIASTFMEVGVSIDQTDQDQIAAYLEKSLDNQHGVVGFTPETTPDADDTSRSILTLAYLGKPYSVDGLINKFDDRECGAFRTYVGERNPSFSANCNVLICLLTMPADKNASHVPQIANATQFLTTQAFGGHVNEKWHLKELYWMLLLGRAYSLLYQQDSILLGVFSITPSLQEHIPMVALHILIKILHSQQNNGSWGGGNCEATAYAILALGWLSELPFIRAIRPENYGIAAAMARGKTYLHSQRNDWRIGSYVWVEKVSYASNMLSEAYCIAAALIPLPTIEKQGESRIQATIGLPDKMIQRMRETGSLLTRTSVMANIDPLLLYAAETQACYALRALQKEPVEIFPRAAKGKDKYLSMVPLAFTACAAAQGSFVELPILNEMMVLSILNFRADEYMEGVVEKHFVGNLDAVRDIVSEVLKDVAASTEAQGRASHRPEEGQAKTQQHHSDKTTRVTSDHSHSLESIRNVMTRFARHVLLHKAVIASPASHQKRLAYELKTFLLAHIDHAEDNHRFYQQDRAEVACHGHSQIDKNGYATAGSDTEQSVHTYQNPGRTFYQWVGSTSADHTSCPFSFAFFSCLVHTFGQKTPAVFDSSARISYLAEDLCRHLASLCRMYNDAGSLKRDVQELNLNSANFPEFTLGSAKRIKEELLWIAEYERCGIDNAFSALEHELGDAASGVLSALRLFVNVTDIYGQVYILSDIGTRTK